MPEKKKTNPKKAQQGIDSPNSFEEKLGKFGKGTPKEKAGRPRTQRPKNSPSGKPKPKKAPPGTKIGPGRKEKKGNPHGVDDGTIYLKNGGSVSKFPDLSGDGKVTQKDILMGRGVIKRKRGGPVDTPKKKRGNYGPNIGKPFKAMGPVGGLPVNKSGTKIMAGKGRKGLKQLKTIAKSVGVPGATAGLASGIAKSVKKLAGRLATRGYGKARK